MTDQVNILLVDDRPDKLLAIEAALAELGENVVAAGSGREALRHVLRTEFAVILLDINMPDMDGFECAELIRKYRVSRHTPIIFLTSGGDDALLWRSYALGAVDYIPTPVIPTVLRSKVRAFVDLFRKAAQIERQAAALARQAARQRLLTQASIAINSEMSLDGMLQAITDAARTLIGAEQATITLELPAVPLRTATSRADAAKEGGEPVSTLARRALTAPLTDRSGHARGAIRVSGKQDGDVDADDEAALLQLSQLGSLAIQTYLNAEAFEANRLKDEFLATLSHELRTPLTALVGWTRLLRTGPQDPARIARGIEVIERNVNLQASLIEELLDVSRITAGKLRIDTRPIQLAPIAGAVVDALQPAAEAKGVTLSLLVLDDSASVLGDAERLHQVVANLAGNAVKFTPRGGRITLSIARDGGDATLTVEDNGEGIPREFLPYVFERFRQADSSITRARNGLGLGLAVARHLIELHGGTVHASSEGQGRGSTFVVRLPAIVEERAPATLPEPHITSEPPPVTGEIPVSPPQSGVQMQTLDGVRVLVVDDDDDARELVKEVLCRHRAQVTTASSASEALDALATAPPHVLVSDVAMAGQDGYELIRRVRNHGDDVPALALTAYARREDRARALAAGFQMHATKPIEPNELIAAVARLANGRPA